MTEIPSSDNQTKLELLLNGLLDVGHMRLLGGAGVRHAYDKVHFEPLEEDHYVDTSITPYSPEVDLTNIEETASERKDAAQPLSVIRVEGDDIGQQALRDLLAVKYPESEYPDIYKIIQSGLLLTRFFSRERLPQVRARGTDRDYNSTLAYQGENNETEVVRVNNLDRSRVTYLASLRTSNKSLDGGEQRLSFKSMYGDTMLVYDPRYVQQLGFTSSGLSYFPEGGHKALLAILQSSSMDVGK